MSICPKGHASAASDYCDECGSPIEAPRGAAREAGVCPDCATPRESGARFCEVCQYDFQQGQSAPSDSRIARSDALARAGLRELSAAGAPTPAPTSPAAGAPAPAQPAAPAAPILSAPLLARVQSDPSLCPDDESRQAFPAGGVPDLVFHLDLDENLVGRESASKNAHPEIPLGDPGASRRHLKLLRLDGAYHALELGSANGTTIDGAVLPAGEPRPIGPGTQIRLGMWTRILIEAR